MSAAPAGHDHQDAEDRPGAPPGPSTPASQVGGGPRWSSGAGGALALASLLDFQKCLFFLDLWRFHRFWIFGYHPRLPGGARGRTEPDRRRQGDAQEAPRVGLKTPGTAGDRQAGDRREAGRGRERQKKHITKSKEDFADIKLL